MVRRPVLRAGPPATPSSSVIPSISAATPTSTSGLEADTSRHNAVPAWVHFAYAGYPIAKELAISYSGMMTTGENPKPKPTSIVHPSPSLQMEATERNIYHESRKKHAFLYTVFDRPCFFPTPLFHNRFNLPNIMDFQLAFDTELDRACDIGFPSISYNQQHRLFLHHIPLEGLASPTYNYMIARDYRPEFDNTDPYAILSRNNGRPAGTVEYFRLGLVETADMGRRLRENMVNEATKWAESCVCPISHLPVLIYKGNFPHCNMMLLGQAINLLYFMNFQATKKYAVLSDNPDADMSGCEMVQGKPALPPMVEDQLNVWLCRQVIARQRIFDEWYDRVVESNVGVNTWAALFLVVVSLAYVYDRILVSRFEQAKSDERMLKAYVAYLNQAEETICTLIKKYRVALARIPNRHEWLPHTAYKPTLEVLETIRKKDTSVFSERVLRWTTPLTDFDMEMPYVSPEAVKAELVEDMEKLAI